MELVTADLMRKIEQGIPSIKLMENASLAVLKHCQKYTERRKKSNVIIFCGSGNNGGDGMALACYLHEKEANTKIVFLGNPGKLKGDPAEYYKKIKELKIQIEFELPGDNIIKESDLVVDAMFGTGLTRNIEGKFASATELINKYSKYVIAVDIPSGINSDTGQVMGCAVRADETITFGYPKFGLYKYPGAEYAGIVHIEDIGLPDNIDFNTMGLFSDSQVLTEKEAASLLPARPVRSNKGTFGKVLVFAGSNEMPGAASLACSASYASGAGLVCACVLNDVAKAIHAWQREVVTRIVPGKDGMYCKESLQTILSDINNYSVILLGPGIGRSSFVAEFVREILNSAKTPLILDADALFAVSEDTGILKTIKVPCVITPHFGEMGKLTGLPVSKLMEAPAEYAVNFARDHNIITLLKDFRTVIARPNGGCYFNPTGCNALAKGGSGDVLAGMIAGFAAQGMGLAEASALSAYIHGRAGEFAARDLSNYCVTASDVIKYIPKTIKKMLKNI